jgi:hypothetical protein
VTPETIEEKEENKEAVARRKHIHKKPHTSTTATDEHDRSVALVTSIAATDERMHQLSLI